MAIPFVASFMRKRSRTVQAFVKVIEVMLLSTGLISTLLMLKGALFIQNSSSELVFSSLLDFWNSVKCFFSFPLSTFIIISSMVFLIKFSSTFHHRVVPINRDHVANIQTGVLPPPPPPTPSPSSSQPPPSVAMASPDDISTKTVTIKELQETSHADSPNILHGTIKQDGVTDSPNIFHGTIKEDGVSDSPNILHGNIKQDGVRKPKRELRPKTLDIKKTISLRNPIPNSQESPSTKMETKTYPSKRGKAISTEKEDIVTNEEEGDSMEATWRAIMGGGKQSSKKRPLKKSETWDVPTRPRNEPMKRLDSEVVVPSSPIWREMRNAETFNDAMSFTRRGGLIRRDSSMSLEDFNNKIEGFIKKLKWKSKAK